MATWTYLIEGRRLEVRYSMWGKLSVQLDGAVVVEPRVFLGLRRNLQFTSREGGRTIAWRVVFDGRGYLRMPTLVERDGAAQFQFKGRS